MSDSESVPAIRPFDDSTDKAIEALAERTRLANGPLMKAVNWFGSKAENAIENYLPEELKGTVEDLVIRALRASYSAASASSTAKVVPNIGSWGHRAAVAVTGAGGGVSGLPSTVVELPATISIMFASIQKIARSYGFDTTSEEIKLECLKVFGSGSPLRHDDGVELSFVTAKTAISGASVERFLTAIAPRFAAAFGQKLGAQTIPVLGAVAGATINVAFLNYYEEMAHVRFGLLRLAQVHGADAVEMSYRNAMQGKLTRKTQ